MMPSDISLPRSWAESVARERTAPFAPLGSRVSGRPAGELSGCFNPAHSPITDHLDQFRGLGHFVAASGTHDHLASAEVCALGASLLGLFLCELVGAERASGRWV